MTDYEWLTEMGLCHRCRKNKAVRGKKFCFDCIEKYTEENAKRYDSEYAKEYQTRRREIYREKKEKGICVRCSKKATHGLFCLECSIKAKKHNKKTAERRRLERHERGLIPEMRVENGLCFWCGNKLSAYEKENGIKLCQSCMEKARKGGKKGAQNSPFRKDERERYEKNRRWKSEHLQTAVQEAD